MFLSKYKILSRYKIAVRGHEITHFAFSDRKMAKLGVVGGAVYFTVATGVWGRDTKQVQSLMEQALGQVEGTGKQKVTD